jgi:tripartite-type tricarboxylate transporter receptor subunit TctC
MNRRVVDERSPSRRDVLKAGIAAGGAAVLGGLPVAPAVAAEKFPSKPISIVSDSPAGGGFDRAIRMLEPEWEKRTGQPINVVFAVGAGGQIAATRIIRNPPDGYTLGYNAITNLQIMIHQNKPKEFGPESFAYLGTFMIEPLAIIVRKDAKWGSFKDMYEESKRERINVGVGQPKTYYHLAGLILNDATGSKFNFVHYGGGGASRTALMAGEVPAVLTGLFSAADIFDRTRGLLVFAPKNPIPDVWDMPTSQDVMPGTSFPQFLHPNALYCPLELQTKSPERFEYLVKVFRETFDAPATRERAVKGGFPAASLEYWSPEQCKAYERELRSQLTALKL